LAELSVPARSVLKTAAVLGARFRRDVLAAVTGVPPGELVGSMLQVTRALVLAQVGRTEEARAQFEAVAPLLPALARDSEWLPAVAQVAEKWP